MRAALVALENDNEIINNDNWVLEEPDETRDLDRSIDRPTDDLFTELTPEASAAAGSSSGSSTMEPAVSTIPNSPLGAPAGFTYRQGRAGAWGQLLA